MTIARPKIAEYPFSTLSPNLGVVGLSDGRSFVIADIPGIIEGAHSGKGLGDKFLQHVERTKVLAYLVPIDGECEPSHDTATKIQELADSDPNINVRKLAKALLAERAEKQSGADSSPEADAKKDRPVGDGDVSETE